MFIGLILFTRYTRVNNISTIQTLSSDYIISLYTILMNTHIGFLSAWFVTVPESECVVKFVNTGMNNSHNFTF